MSGILYGGRSEASFILVFYIQYRIVKYGIYTLQSLWEISKHSSATEPIQIDFGNIRDSVFYEDLV